MTIRVKYTPKYPQCRTCVYLNCYTKDCELDDIAQERINPSAPKKYKVTKPELKWKTSMVMIESGGGDCGEFLARMGVE